MENSPLETFFYQLDRSDFMITYKPLAVVDKPLPIGYGQTISQPSLVLNMTRLLDLGSDHVVLEIGTGSGYQTCLLAEFSREVYTVERIPELHYSAQNRLNVMGYKNIHYILGDGSRGYSEGPLYDRIMVTAAASCVPEELMEQLALGGIMIIPVGDTNLQYIQRVTKDMEGRVNIEKLQAVRFVPLVGRYSSYE